MHYEDQFKEWRQNHCLFMVLDYRPLQVSQTWKQPSLHDFLTKTKTKVGLVPNLNCETRKTKKEHNKCKTRFQQDFITRRK